MNAETYNRAHWVLTQRLDGDTDEAADILDRLPEPAIRQLADQAEFTIGPTPPTRPARDGRAALALAAVIAVAATVAMTIGVPRWIIAAAAIWFLIGNEGAVAFIEGFAEGFGKKPRRHDRSR